MRMKTPPSKLNFSDIKCRNFKVERTFFSCWYDSYSRTPYFVVFFLFLIGKFKSFIEEKDSERYADSGKSDEET